MTNLNNYSHTPYIHFENAGSDSYVPTEAAHRFLSNLRHDIYSECPEHIDINELPNQEHGFPPEMWHKCLEWFCKRASD
ncbi:hypothetical protein D3C81_1836610 [compost metagenome]